MKNILLELTEDEFMRLKKAKLMEESKTNASLPWRTFIIRCCVAHKGIHKNKLRKKQNER
jgi:hypothetical protein